LCHCDDSFYVCIIIEKSGRHTQPTYPVLAVARFSGASSSLPAQFDKPGRGPPSKNRDNPYCRYCCRRGHTVDKCWRKAKSSASVATVTTVETTPSPAATSGETPGSDITLSPADFEAIINQVLARSGNVSSFVLSVAR
jgi:hypothetical protein